MVRQVSIVDEKGLVVAQHKTSMAGAATIDKSIINALGRART